MVLVFDGSAERDYVGEERKLQDWEKEGPDRSGKRVLVVVLVVVVMVTAVVEAIMVVVVVVVVRSLVR